MILMISSLSQQMSRIVNLFFLFFLFALRKHGSMSRNRFCFENGGILFLLIFVYIIFHQKKSIHHQQFPFDFDPTNIFQYYFINC